ncbi:Hypothetical predicted protein [Octopus vulgaris]|uniref:Uncharacterized protein n=1 Tax=Octopus vulgaris TaxID=6645 RepID=A0AA36AFZ9_OCTVU|nr:Hypothetical predicted protein [Octopus vulgaris]
MTSNAGGKTSQLCYTQKICGEIVNLTRTADEENRTWYLHCNTRLLRNEYGNDSSMVYLHCNARLLRNEYGNDSSMV